MHFTTGSSILKQMIFHVNCINDQWEIPNLELDLKYSYVIGLRKIWVEFNSNTVDKRNLLGLRTSLVDLSIKNPSQCIALFPCNMKSDTLYYEPLVIVYHPLQIRSNIRDSSFDLLDVLSEHKINFSRIFICLEIQRTDYARF